MVMSGSLNANISSLMVSKKQSAWPSPQMVETWISYGREKKSVSTASLELFPWVESGGNTSHCPPQSVTKTHHPLPGSSANTPAVVPHIVCDCLWAFAGPLGCTPSDITYSYSMIVHSTDAHIDFCCQCTNAPMSDYMNSFLHFLQHSQVLQQLAMPHCSFPADLNRTFTATPPLLSLRHVHFHTQQAFFNEFWLVDNPQYQRTEWQVADPVWTDSTSRMPAFNCISLFLFALMCLFCCTARVQPPVWHAHSHVITCNWLYSVAAIWTGFIWTNLIISESYSMWCSLLPLHKFMHLPCYNWK
jgi:hypothetical protein